jgi:DNA-binding NtrC family response regulator
MPARIVLVHDDPAFLDPLESALQAKGHDVAAFDDSLLAWDALQAAQHVEILITRILFPPGKPHGVALAQWARCSRPKVRVLFIAQPELEAHTEGLGLFLPTPVSVPKIVEIVARLLATDQSFWDYRPR